MPAPEQQTIIELPAPTQPLRRRRSRLGEPTVRLELVVIDTGNPLSRQLLRKQALAVREALQWIADNPPTDQTEADIDAP